MAENRTIEDLERDAFVAEADLIARLFNTPGWAEYEALLVKMRVAAMEEMATAEPEEVRMWQGSVATLKEVLERPRQIIEGAKSVLEDEQSDEQRLLDVQRSLEMTDIHSDEL